MLKKRQKRVETGQLVLPKPKILQEANLRIAIFRHLLYNVNMAKKSTNKNSKSNGKAQSSKTAATKAKKAAKKAYKANPKAFIISVVAIILVAAIATAVVYFAFPDTWDSIISSIKGNKPGGDAPGGDSTDTSKVVGGNLSGTLIRQEGELLFHMLNVGQGDCLYIQFPDGSDMVIDGGTTKKPYDKFSYKDVSNYLKRYITDGKIEHIMLTHTDEDHVSFLDKIVEDFDVDNIYMPYVLATPNLNKLSATQLAAFEKIPQNKKDMFKDPDTVSTVPYAKFFAAALNKEDCTIHLNMDDDDNTNNIVIDDAVTAYELKFYCSTKDDYAKSKLSGAEELNAVSPIGILSYQNRKIMFTGDSNKINEPRVVQRTGKIDCDVLKVGHHGSETSSTQAFLDAYTFEFAMISCGLHQGHKHPRQDALDRMANLEVYRTDKNGTIVLSVDKSGEMEFKSETTSTQKQNHIGYDTVLKQQSEIAKQNLACLFFNTRIAA